MRKAILIFSFYTICFLSVSCSKEASQNLPPTLVQLQFPTQDLLCIDNTIPFNWSDATDPENDDLEYNIIVAKDRQLTNVVENRTLTASQITFILEKSTAFYWQVNAIDIDNNQATSSPVYAFYTKGNGVVNYAPFMANLKSPENNTNITSESLDLIWEGSDTNTTDTLTYELFFSEDEDPVLIENSLSLESYNVSVLSGKTYYWKVNTIDNSGAKSIGQVFSFSVD